MAVLLRGAFTVLALSLSVVAQQVSLQSFEGGVRILLEHEETSQVLYESSAVLDGLMVRPVEGSATSIVTFDEVASGMRVTHAATISGGGIVSAARPIQSEVHLRYARFEPTKGSPTVLPELQSPFGSELWILQLYAPPVQDVLDTLAARNVQILDYLPMQAYLVRVRADAVASLASLPFVRAMTSYHLAYKFDELLLDEQHRGYSQVAERRVNFYTATKGGAIQQRLVERAQSFGGRVESADPMTRVFSARLKTSDLLAFVSTDDVVWVDVWAPDGVDMDVARTFHGSTYLESVAGFDGTGVRAEVMDVGTEVTHPEFVPAPIIHGNVPTGNHGTCTYGIVFANGTDPLARGVLHNAQGIVAYSSSFVGGTRHSHTGELVNPNLAYQAVFQTNSWGGGLTTAYTTTSAAMDTLLFDHDFIILQSQSNAGTQSSRPEAWAKNIISVGGIKHVNTLTKADDNWTNGGSIGPGADGRIKPDLASFYDNIYCSDQVGATGYAGGNYYTNFGGTSGATPITAGHMGLLHQMWHQGIFGNATGSSVFNSRPHAMTAKALLINTATQWTFSGTTHDLTRTHQGWGHADVQKLYDLRQTIQIVDESVVLTQGQGQGYTLTVSGGTPTFHATLAWLDPAGIPSSTLHRVNDLNLKVTAPGGTIYWGNNGLLADMVSSSGGVANTVDTVENVIVNNPAAGVWTVEVSAASVNGDGHVQTPGLDVDFALIVRGVTPAASFNLDMTTVSGTGNFHLGVNNIPSGMTEGYFLFSNNATSPYGAGPLLGLYPDLFTIAALTSPKAPGSILHFELPVVGLFPAAPFDLPPASIPFLTGSRTDGRILVFNATGAFALTEIDRITW